MVLGTKQDPEGHAQLGHEAAFPEATRNSFPFSEKLRPPAWVAGLLSAAPSPIIAQVAAREVSYLSEKFDLWPDGPVVSRAVG